VTRKEFVIWFFEYGIPATSMDSKCWRGRENLFDGKELFVSPEFRWAENPLFAPQSTLVFGKRRESRGVAASPNTEGLVVIRCEFISAPHRRH
jgi:hypothetical protein